MTIPSLSPVFFYGFRTHFFAQVLWDLDLNSISMINLVMAVGLVVDYSTLDGRERGLIMDDTLWCHGENPWFGVEKDDVHGSSIFFSHNKTTWRFRIHSEGDFPLQPAMFDCHLRAPRYVGWFFWATFADQRMEIWIWGMWGFGMDQNHSKPFPTRWCPIVS